MFGSLDKDDGPPPALDLAHVLTVALFGSIVAAAVVLWWTVHPLAGVALPVAAFAAWYVGLLKHRAEVEQRQRLQAALERKEARLTTRPGPIREPLGDGGQVGPAPWLPGSGGGA